MRVIPEVGLREVVPLDRDFACYPLSDRIECSRREIDVTHVRAGRAVITARQR